MARRRGQVRSRPRRPRPAQNAISPGLIVGAAGVVVAVILFVALRGSSAPPPVPEAKPVRKAAKKVDPRAEE